DGRGQCVPAHRPIAVSADVAALRLLLVPAGAHAPDAELAPGAGGCHAGLPDPGVQAPGYAGQRLQAHPGERFAAGLPAETTLVRQPGCLDRLGPDLLQT